MQLPTVHDSTNDKIYNYDENLRSISAIVAAQKIQEESKKISLSKHSNRQSVNSKQPVNIITSTNVSLQQNNLPINKTKARPWRSSKVMPYDNNVFYFDDGSDLTMTDVLSNQCDSIKKYQQNTEQIKAKKKCKCFGIFISLLAIFIIIIIIGVVLVALLVPSGTKLTQT